MEGTERFQETPVRVLRQRYRMSGALKADIVELLPGSERPELAARMALYATKKAYVDLGDYNRGALDAQLQEVKNRIFRRAAESALYLSSQVEVKLVEGRGVRVQVHPRDQRRFNEIVRNYDRLPNVLPQQEPFDHFLHVDIPSVRFLDELRDREDEVAEALGAAFTDEYQGRLRQVTPADVTTDGYDQIRRTPVPEDKPGVELPQAS